jgi:inner membrane protein
VASSGYLASIVRSPSFKFVLVGVLVLFLSIPLAVVWFLVAERQGRAESVLREIAHDWGGSQRILGPYLIVPYTIRVKTIDSGKAVEVERERHAIFLPEALKVTGTVQTEIRQRSIYDVTVYQSAINLEGSFLPPDLRLVEPDASAAPRWQDAFLALAISDVSGLKNNVQLEIGEGAPIAFEPSIGASDGVRSFIYGIHARLGTLAGPNGQGFNGGNPLSYKISLALNGSSALKFAPSGRTSTVALSSNWPHPSFTGFLPASRSITGSGFNASWSVPHLARDVPQAWAEDDQRLTLDRFGNADLGVNLFVPIDLYSLVERALKYGFLFVASAFGGVFVLELLSSKRVHPIQYFFAGLSMVTFYVLLLSLAEHIGFSYAYLCASIATGAMISLYVGKALDSLGRGLIMLSIFSLLYGLLYLILQLEDYALLAGAIAAFVLLTATMFATLRVNWSGERTQPSSP